MKIDRSVFRMDEVEYYADFILAPLYIVFLMHANTMPLRSVLGWLITGFVLWTLVEYLLHRYVLHSTTTFGHQHDDHHQHPRDLVGNPPWITFGLTAITWISLWFLTNSDIASGLTSGLLMGYLMYSEIHMQLHHNANPSDGPWPLPDLHRHHCAHHRGGKKNFGVTTTFWDHLFGTKAS